MNEKIKIVVLAAGVGTRMKNELPKVLVKLNDRPIIKHLLESIHESGIDNRPVIVVGYKKEEVMRELGKEHYDYAVQEEQLGTGHAVLSAEKMLKGNGEHVLVLYGDSPFISAETIKKLVAKHLESKGKITMATIIVPDFKDWRSIYDKSFSRIVRDANGKIVKDVQIRDTKDEEKKITEVNACFLIFNAKWLWEKLKTLDRNNEQKQYYLTDLIEKAIKEGEEIESISIDPREGLAANSKEELEILEKLEV